MARDRPRCPGCGDKYTRKHDEPAVCSLMCAAQVLKDIEHEAKLRGWDWREYLPANRRPDLVPWDAYQAASRLKNGKKAWRRTTTDE